MKINKIIAAGLLSISIISVTACGNSSPKGDTASTKTDSPTMSSVATPAATKKAPIKLTLATYNAWWNLENLKVAIKMYQDETGNTIDPQIYPDDQFPNVIKTKLTTGDAPDVFAFNTSVKDFAPGQLSPLTGPWVSKINMERAAINGYTYAGDSNIYTAPFNTASYMGMMYNKDVMKKAGVTLPLKTFAELEAAAAAIKKLGIVPIYVPNKEAWTAQIDIFAGSHFIGIKEPDYFQKIFSNKLAYKDDPLVVQMFNRVVEMKKKGYMNDDIQSATMPMAEQALVEGKAALVAGGNWLYPDFIKNYAAQAANISMMPFSWGDDPAGLGVEKGAAGNGLFIPKDSKHKKEAEDFINFVMSEKVMKAMSEVSPGVNELGIVGKASSWDSEMQSYIDSGTAKAVDNFVYGAGNVKPGSGFESGDMGGTAQALLAGKDPIKALADMYADSVKKNKAKGIKGFE